MTSIEITFRWNLVILSRLSTFDSKVMMKYLTVAVINLPQNTTDAVVIGMKIIAYTMTKHFPGFDFATVRPYPKSGKNLTLK